MSTVYAAYQQDPLGDDMQAHDTYAPAPDVNFMSQKPSGMNIYGALPQFYWGQWSPTEDASFAKSTNMTAPNVFAQEESRYNYPYDPETSTQWDSPATSTHSYPVPSHLIKPEGRSPSCSERLFTGRSEVGVTYLSQKASSSTQRPRRPLTLGIRNRPILHSLDNVLDKHAKQKSQPFK
jgi:hypothetical protein